jgi:hypothetical protein
VRILPLSGAVCANGTGARTGCPDGAIQRPCRPLQPGSSPVITFSSRISGEGVPRANVFEATPAPVSLRSLPGVRSGDPKMGKQEDTAVIAGQLADLTRAVERMANQLSAVRERADTQQERIDLAAKELAEVSTRLQAAANALRESI